MTFTRYIGLAVAIASASALIACTTPPATPMGSATGKDMATPEHMAAIDAQMKTMHAMHTRMTNAKTANERQALMAEHMKAMQGGMAMMKDMHSMGAMGDSKAMSADMTPHHGMMAKHMEMMQTMMAMMAQRMPPSPGNL